MTRVEKYIQKANVLVEALPYIKKFSGKTIVIKYGGSSMNNDGINKIIDDIVLLKLIGINIVLVHGGGPLITEMLEKLNIETEFVNGLRKTDEETIDVVEMVLSGKINKNLVRLIQLHNVNAVGISGVDGNLIEVKKTIIKEGDIGFVGDVTKVNKALLESLISSNYIPVIAPLGVDKEGQKYNINADILAASIAKSISAEKLIFMTDVQGVFKDGNDPSSLCSVLTEAKTLELLEAKTINGGMIPKVESALSAINNGVKHVHIIDGKLEHSLILEILTKIGVGTLFVKEGDSNE